VSAAKKLQKKSTRHACRHRHSHLGVNVCDDVGVIIMSHVVAESESWPRLVIFDFSYCGDGAGVSCRGMSGGAGLVLTRTAHALMSPKNRSPELAMASAWVKCLLLRGSGLRFFRRCLNLSRRRPLLRNVRLPSFLWLRVSRRLLEFAVHHHPGFTADNNVVPLTCNMRSRLYLILRCEPGERAVTGGVTFGVARPRPRY